MRYLSLFSGIEAASCAWSGLEGWECVGFSEVEKFPCEVLATRFPHVPNLGDVTKITKEQLDALKPVDLIVGGSPCFTADTLVTTDRGPVPICDIKVGDVVLTHKGRWQRVLRVGHKQAETIYVKGQGVILHCTRNHPIWARAVHSKWNNDNRVYEREFESMCWVPAEYLDHMYCGSLLKSDSLKVPQPELTGRATVTFDPNDLNVLELAGRYLADGEVRIFGGEDGERHGSIRISCGKYRRAVMDNLVARVPFNCTAVQERSCIRYQFHGKAFAAWVKQNFGSGAGNKYIPSWVYGLNALQKAALIKGYLDGAGYRKATHWKCSTISKKLAVGIKMLAEHLGVSVSISYINKESTCIIEGRTVNQHSYWELAIYDKARSSLALDGYRWGLVRKIIPGEVETVYNLEVETDNSYIADGICAHNCQGFSVAGKQGGLNDVRSKLAETYVCIIAAVRPRWIVWENVPGVFSTNGGMDFRIFTAALTELGYGICWRVLDAQYFGVAQRRRRVFLVGYFGNPEPPAKVLFECESLPRYLAACAETGQRIAQGAAGGVGAASAGAVAVHENARHELRTSDKAYSLRTGGGKPGQGRAVVFENHGQDTRFREETRTAQTVSATFGTGGNNQPLVISDNDCYAVTTSYGLRLSNSKSFTLDSSRTRQSVLCSESSFADYKVSDYASTLKARGGGRENFVVLEDQGGAVMNIPNDGKVGTLRAETHGHEPLVYRIGSYASNGMKSDNPHSGIYKTDKANTLDASDPSPACQQGGLAVVHEDAVVCVNSRQTPVNGAVSGPLDTSESGSQAVVVPLDLRNARRTTTDDNAGCGVGAPGDKEFTVTSSCVPGGYHQKAVRKLTPVECLRLQGFPDNWLDDVPGYSDTAAYKAIGNSMAVPCMRFLGERIAEAAIREAVAAVVSKHNGKLAALMADLRGGVASIEQTLERARKGQKAAITHARKEAAVLAKACTSLRAALLAIQHEIKPGADGGNLPA